MKNGHGTTKNISPQETLERTKIRNCIVSQLAIAQPASLPLSLLMKGIACVDNSCQKKIIEQILQDLVSENSIIKISECGFHDRYQLIDGVTDNNRLEDE